MAFSGYIVRGASSDNNRAFQFNPFVLGAKFKIIKFCYLVQIEGFDADGNPIPKKNKENREIELPALQTTLGEIRLTEIYRPQSTIDNSFLEKDSQFAKDLVATLVANRGKSTDEVLQAVVDKFKDREFIVKSAKPFKGVAQDGNPYDGTFRIYDYVTE